MKWAYGVTTVSKRRSDLLPRTLASLRAAGFPQPRLFVDGNKDITSWENEFRLETTIRYPLMRTFGNWVLGLAELYIRNPHADRYAMFQDDFVTYPNLRDYLERCRYPDEGPGQGYWNLYTFPENQSLAKRIGQTARFEVGWYASNQKGKGAVALVFSQKAVVTLLTQRHMVERPQNAIRGWRAIDGGIVTAFRKAGWLEYVHHPSLVQHTGIFSSMGNKQHRLAESFRGENYNALELLKGE